MIRNLRFRTQPVFGSRRSTIRSGFTLFELIIASTLTVLLMGGLMAAVGAVGSDRRMLQHLEGTSSIAGQAAVEQIETDFRNARRMWPVEGGGVIITGYCGIDRKTLQNDNRLARVVYTVIDGDLVRVQEYLDDAKPQRWMEIVARRVGQFTVTRIPDQAELDEYARMQQPPPEPPIIPAERALMPWRGAASTVGRPIPERVGLSLAFEGQPDGAKTSQELVVR